MLFPDYRPRRLRQSEAFRRMIRETVLTCDDLILPLFAVNGKGVENPIPSMPGHSQLSIDKLVVEAKKAFDSGIPAIIDESRRHSSDRSGLSPVRSTLSSVIASTGLIFDGKTRWNVLQ